jgi:macrolide-specific efflux system membrane fusion protein
MKQIWIFLLLLISNSCAAPDTSVSPVRKDVIDAVFATGHTIFEREYVVATTVEGFITQQHVKEGDTVQQGDNLFHIAGDVQDLQLANAMLRYQDARNRAAPNAPQVVSLDAQIQQAEVQAELDEKNLNRYAQLLKADAISQVEYDQIKVQYEVSKRQVAILKKSLADLRQALQFNVETARKELEIQRDFQKDYLITATMDGVVLSILKKENDLASRGQPLAKIGGGVMLIRLYIAEEDIRYIALGQRIWVELNTNKDQLLEAEITRIYPTFDEVAQSFILEAHFKATSPPVLHHTQLQANIIIDTIERALVLPLEYVNTDNTVVLADETVVTVETGVRAGRWVEIKSGLGEDSQVILKNE